MRKFLIPAAVALSAIAVASPAAAQYYPAPQPQPYGYNQGNGYNQGYGNGRQLEVRVQQIRNQIRQLDRARVISNREARNLEGQARNLQQRVRRIAYNGVNQRERYDVERQIRSLEIRVQREARDRNGRPGYANGNGYNQPYGVNPNDRDHDGRFDRYEDDRGTRPD